MTRLCVGVILLLLVSSCGDNNSSTIIINFKGQDEVIVTDYDVYDVDREGHSYSLDSSKILFSVYLVPKKDFSFLCNKKIDNVELSSGNETLMLAKVSSMITMPYASEKKHFIPAYRKCLAGSEFCNNKKGILLYTKNKDELFKFLGRRPISYCE